MRAQRRRKRATDASVSNSPRRVQVAVQGREEENREMASKVWRSAVAVATIAALGMSTSDAFLECRQPNYVAKNGKIYAVDPADTTVETEIKIKGVAWSGMEKDNMIPDGLWGTTSNNKQGVQATTVSKVLQFMTNNSFNSVRLPLNAEFVSNDPLPQIAYIHAYENREITTWDDPNKVRYLDLIGRMIETFQNVYATVLLDIHLLDKYDEDAYWYTAPYVNITESGTYKAVSYLASSLCNAGHWNVIGVDIKNEMLEVQWNEATDSNIKNDWKGAAEILANRIIELCPQWLVFIGGASSPTDFQRFRVSEDYTELSNHWNGGNFKNATKNPIKMAVDNKLVYAPHAHSHGVLPQNYFYTAKSNCSTTTAADEFEGDAAKSECVEFVDGQKTTTQLKCSKSQFSCESYAHLPVTDLVTQYKKVMNEAVGSLQAEGKTMILGSFSGVYGSGQPQQTAILDYLIEYAASIQGGYFWALNPDSEYYLEDSIDKKKGIFGRTHYGVMKTTSWQQAHEDLLQALAKMPSSDVPCYGGVAKKAPGASSATTLKPNSLVAVTVVAAMLLAFAV
ncbi:Cell 5a endo1, partial [Globisporangium splendens]